MNNTEQGKRKNGLKVYIPLTIVVLIVIIGCILWYKEYIKYISTDDAYIDTDRVNVGTKILGRISSLYVDEGDTVVKGQLIAELDSNELNAAKKLDLSLKNQLKISVQQSEMKYRSDAEKLKLNEISGEKATDDYNRAKTQFQGGVLTQEQFEHIKKAYETAITMLKTAQMELKISETQIKIANAAIANADSKLLLDDANLKNTKIYAPISGVVSKRWLQAGDIAQAGSSIIAITSTNNHWVAVFLEETYLNKLRIGQNVKIFVDAFPNVELDGNITTIGSNTASQFSLIPPNNASGNFTKITQRVPLKVSINGKDSNGLYHGVKLISGMSAVIKIVK